MAFNHISFIGRLTSDPEARTTTNGKSVASFTVANDSDFKDANGEKRTTFFRCQAWGNTAEFASKYLKKGRLVIVSGRIESRDYVKDGINRQAWEVTAAEVSALDSAPKNEGASALENTKVAGTDEYDPFEDE
jgi:single-strand DNA-binding protein